MHEDEKISSSFLSKQLPEHTNYRSKSSKVFCSGISLFFINNRKKLTMTFQTIPNYNHLEMVKSL